MAYDIGTARGVIEMEYNGRGIDQAQSDLQNLEGSGNRANDTLRNVSRTAGGMSIAMAGGLAVAVNSAANFEQRLSAIEAVSGATGAEMDKISDKALQLGKDTAFSATESASAMEELVKAGLTVDEVLNGAADATVALAAAGEIDLPAAATIASNAMNQFNLGAKDMPKVADAIAGAANASAIDVGQFGESLQQVGAVANLAGIDFEDTATAIALMGNAGITGSDAGTSLKSMLMRLQPVTKKQKELMNELGITTKDGANAFYDAQGNTKSLGQISGVLSKSLEGMTKKQKQATLQTLFGSDAIRAAAIMADNGKKGFDKMNKSLGNTTAAEVAATRMDNMKGRLEELKGSLETAGITIGTALIPVVEVLIAFVTRLANWFLGLSDNTQKWVAFGLLAVTMVLGLIAVVGRIIIFMARLRMALAVLRTSMIVTWLAALGPIGLVIAIIAAVIAIIVLLWKKSETFRNIVIGVWEAIKGAAQKAWDAITGAIEAALTIAMNKIREVKDDITGFFSDAGEWLKDAGKAIIQGVIDGITAMMGSLRDKAGEVLGVLGKLLPGSPVKEGPLKVLNRGYAGKQIVQMVIDGIGDMAGPLADAMDGVITVPTGYATPSPGSTAKPRRKRAGGDSRRDRIVDGELRLAPDGRAFITGVAVEADDDDDDFDDTLGRMNR